MIVVSGTMEIDRAGVEGAKAAALEMMRDTALEAGCIVYEFSQVIGSETTFRVYEEWQDLDALKAHFEAPHMATFRAALAGVGIKSRQIFRMEGGEKTEI